jgi:hypothetical protein
MDQNGTQKKGAVMQSNPVTITIAITITITITITIIFVNPLSTSQLEPQNPFNCNAPPVLLQRTALGPKT